MKDLIQKFEGVEIKKKQKKLRLGSEPIEIWLDGHFILKERPAADIIKITHEENEKVKGYIEIQINIIENEEVMLLQRVSIVRSYSHKKYKVELENNLNEYFDDILIDQFSEENFKMGEFYCGECYYGDENLEKIIRAPRKVSIKEVDPKPFANLTDTNSYLNKIVFEYEGLLFSKHEPGYRDKKTAFEKIKNQLERNSQFYKKEERTIMFLIGNEQGVYYQQIGFLINKEGR